MSTATATQIVFVSFKEYTQRKDEGEWIRWNKHPIKNENYPEAATHHWAHRLELVQKLQNFTPESYAPTNYLVSGSSEFTVITTHPSDLQHAQQCTWKIRVINQDGQKYYAVYNGYENGNGYEDSEILWEEDGKWYSGMAIGSWSSSVRRYKGDFINGGVGSIARII